MNNVQGIHYKRNEIRFPYHLRNNWTCHFLTQCAVCTFCQARGPQRTWGPGLPFLTVGVRRLHILCKVHHSSVYVYLYQQVHNTAVLDIFTNMPPLPRLPLLPVTARRNCLPSAAKYYIKHSMNTTNNFGREIVTPIEFQPNRCIFQLIEINRGKHYKVAVIDTGGKLQNKP